MHRPLVFFGILFLLVSTAICDVSAQRPPKGDPDYDTLLVWMEGSFSSERQSKLDTAYFDIRLHMKRIWRDRSDGAWFYVEQSMASAPDKPYRQRIYRIQRVEEGMLESMVYVLPDPASVVGGWQDTARFADLSPDKLTLRRGCEVYMQATGDSYVGGTHGTACASDLRGASYATSEVTLFFDRLLSWDRGFDASSTQVWGATKGPYIFFKD